MKRIILITIICLLIPSFGIFDQASASIFSIEGTLWRARLLYVPNHPYGEWPQVESGVNMIGFYDDKVYICSPEDGDTCEPNMTHQILTIIDRPVISMAYYWGPMPYTDPEGPERLTWLAIMLPIGIGYLTSSMRQYDEGRTQLIYNFTTGIMVKESDEWSP
jgi:hypothetical protein